MISNFHSNHDVTSVIVTHEMKVVRDVSERVIMLHEGGVRYDGRSQELLNSSDSVISDFVIGKSN